jgi:hypothetical protein
MSDTFKITPGSREIEHGQNQDSGLARKSSVPKKSDTPSPIHPSMRDRVTTTLGAPPTGSPSDASSPLVTDPSRQRKVFPVPAVTQGCKSDPERAHYDPALAHAIMNEAQRASDDFARDLHTVLSDRVEEN